MKKNIYKIGVLYTLLALPMMTFALTSVGGKTLRDVVVTITGYLSVAIGLIISFAVVTFVFNVYRYFFTESKDKKEAGLYVLYSTIGFFVILSLWGLVNLLSNTFKLQNTQPDFPFGASNLTTPSKPPADIVPGSGL